MKKLVSILLMFVLFITVSDSGVVKANTVPNYTGFGGTKTITLTVSGEKIYEVELRPAFMFYNDKIVKTGKAYKLVYVDPSYDVQVTYPSGTSDSCIVYQISYKTKGSSTYKVGSVYGACGTTNKTVTFVQYY